MGKRELGRYAASPAASDRAWVGRGLALAIALASDFASPLNQGQLVMLMSAGIPIGFVAGGLLAGQIVRGFDWPAIFMVGGVLLLATIPPLAKRATAHRHKRL